MIPQRLKSEIPPPSDFVVILPWRRCQRLPGACAKLFGLRCDQCEVTNLPLGFQLSLQEEP